MSNLNEQGTSKFSEHNHLGGWSAECAECNPTEQGTSHKTIEGKAEAIVSSESSGFSKTPELESLSSRELDALVAERFFEPKPPSLQIADCGLTYGEDCRTSDGWDHLHDKRQGFDCIWTARPFSTDIAAAMEVLERVANDGVHECKVTISRDAGTHWEIDFEDWTPGKGWLFTGCHESPSMARAICLAALQVIELRQACASASALASDSR